MRLGKVTSGLTYCAMVNKVTSMGSGVIRSQGHNTRLTRDRHLTYAWYAVRIGVRRPRVGDTQWVARGVVPWPWPLTLP